MPTTRSNVQINESPALSSTVHLTAVIVRRPSSAGKKKLWFHVTGGNQSLVGDRLFCGYLPPFLFGVFIVQQPVLALSPALLR
jgi:hypothetical protein